MRRGLLAPMLLMLAASACGDDGDDESTTGHPATATPTTPDAGTVDGPPVYAVESYVFSEGSGTGRFSYVVLLSSLDTQPTVELAGAREFAGYASVAEVDGKLFVGDGETPTLTSYALDEREVLTPEQTLSFAQYTSASISASIYLRPDKAYVPFDITRHVVWNPQTFQVTGELPAPADIPLVREGLALARGNQTAVRGQTLFQPYYWVAMKRFTRTSQIAVIDTATDTQAPTLEAPCPHLFLTTQDDRGDLYFSNGQGSIPAAVVDPTHPRNCFVRIPAGSNTVDPASTVEFRSLTDGREGSNLFHVGGGVALFNVYHGERDTPEVRADVEKVSRSANYHLWTLDLRTMKAAIMEGVEYGGGQFVTARVDDRTFVAIPAPDYSSTAVYEVLPSGRAEKRFDVNGWVLRLLRLR